MDVLIRIRQLLDEHGWSEYKLSKMSGVAQSTLSNMFKRNNAPTIPTLEAICNGFGITLSQFFAREGDSVVLSREQHEMLESWSTLSNDKKDALKKLLENM